MSAAASEVVPAQVTRAVVEAEWPAVQAFCARKGWKVVLDFDTLTLTVRLAHPKDATDTPMLKLVADLRGYRAVAPGWKFVDPDTDAISSMAFPREGEGQSIFHSQLVLCAPWNRFAYVSEGGIHGDWGATSEWMKVEGHTRATRIADMLAAVHVHLQASPGRRA